MRSWLTQDYAGPIQILFGVASAEDPACAIVKRLLLEFPACDAQLVICPERLGANAKVSKLAQLEPRAKHEIVVVSDADVLVPPDLLQNLIAPLRDESVGLIHCFYRYANAVGPAMQCEAIAVNADFWSQVLQGAGLHKLDFALGAVMAMHRKLLGAVGGFPALTDCLADDYQLGHRIARRGYRIEICPVVVECWSSRMGWREVWRHQLRWARTFRVCKPTPYFFSIVSNATLWPMLWLLTALMGITLEGHGGPVGRVFSAGMHLTIPVLVAALFLLARLLVAGDLQRRLAQSYSPLFNVWLVPVKDLLNTALWVCAFTGRRIEWRGEHFCVRRDGTMVKK